MLFFLLCETIAIGALLVQTFFFFQVPPHTHTYRSGRASGLKPGAVTYRGRLVWAPRGAWRPEKGLDRPCLSVCVCVLAQATQNILATTAGSELRLMDQTYGLKLTRMHLIAEGQGSERFSETLGASLFLRVCVCVCVEGLTLLCAWYVDLSTDPALVSYLMHSHNSTDDATTEALSLLRVTAKDLQVEVHTHTQRKDERRQADAGTLLLCAIVWLTVSWCGGVCVGW